MATPQQEIIDKLSVQRKRILSMIPEDRWTEAIDIISSLARVEQVHLSRSEFMKVAHSLAKMGLISIKQRHRDQKLKRTPVAPKTPALTPIERKPAQAKVDTMKEDKVVPINTEKEPDIIEQIDSLESMFLDFAEYVSKAMSSARAEIIKLREVDKEEVEKLREISVKYTRMREMFKLMQQED